MGKSSTRIWNPSNVYPSASIGDDVSIGTFSEVGENVTIGDRVRIGAFCFIPEGVTIADDVWIGPRVTFTNDRFPPSDKRYWGKIVVEERVSIGASVTILPNVTIGHDAVIGAGSVVIGDIPPNEVWAGVPAKRLRARTDR